MHINVVMDSKYVTTNVCFDCLEGVLEAADHTNTMMWIGRMEDCPIDLSSQVRGCYI
jgi:hypothetical protein